MTKKLLQNEYQAIFHNSQAPMLIIDTDAPDYTMLDVNQAYLSATNTVREILVGKPVFGVFPANPTDNESKNIERTIFSFQYAIENREPHTMTNYRYDIPIPGTDSFEERYWTTSNTPVLDENDNVLYLIHSPQNVTELYKLSISEKAAIEGLKSQKQALYATFMQAPVGIGIFKGPDYRVDLANAPLCALYAKTPEELLNKPIFDVLTHAKGIGLEELLDGVRLTGVPFNGIGIEVPLMRNGSIEVAYVDFVYEPYREADGSISGVIAVATEVTGQVKAKKLLEEAEERARLAVDAVGLGTYDVNLETGESVTSVQFARIFGFDQPATRTEYAEALYPEDRKLRDEAHEQALNTGTLEYEARIVWKDQSVHWAKVDGKVIYDQDGKPFRIVGTALDITEQRRAKEEQRKLITLADNSVDLMSILGLDGINSYINAAGRKLLGFETEQQVREIPISNLHNPEHFEQVKREVLPTVMSEGKWSGTMLVKHLQTGEIFPVFNHCMRIDDPVSGLPIAVGAVMRDLRPELAAKQALADSELLLRNITTAAPITLWMSDERGAITYINETWVKWTGQFNSQSMGAGWLLAVVSEDRYQVKEKLIKAIAAKSLFEEEFRIWDINGTIRCCIATGQPQHDEDGIFSGYIGACVDITEQKYLQQQKDDFIGIASHELKTPVTSIKAYTQVLERILLKKGDTSEALMIRKMDIQISRLTSLIGDLLDVTKINSGRLQFNDQEFDFNRMVKELVEDLQRTTDRHSIIENYLETGSVYGDKERISQVIVNLVTNAIKYSPGADKIVIHTSQKDGEVILCVQDFGIGIPENNLDRVFEQFYRVSGDMQHTFPGLGLGLYISSEIIKREGGRIWVNSREGEGSSFCFALPVSSKQKEDGK